MKKRKIAIIHFQALELYPPAMNCILFFEKELGDADITVYTTKCKKDIPVFRPADPARVKIRRYPPPQDAVSGLAKAIGYTRFYLSVLLSLIRLRPPRVFYFET